MTSPEDPRPERISQEALFPVSARAASRAISRYEIIKDTYPHLAASHEALLSTNPTLTKRINHLIQLRPIFDTDESMGLNAHTLLGNINTDKYRVGFSLFYTAADIHSKNRVPRIDDEHADLLIAQDVKNGNMDGPDIYQDVMDIYGRLPLLGRTQEGVDPDAISIGDEIDLFVRGHQTKDLDLITRFKQVQLEGFGRRYYTFITTEEYFVQSLDHDAELQDSFKSIIAGAADARGVLEIAGDRPAR